MKQYIKTFLDNNKKDLKYLFVLCVLLLIIAIPKLLVQYSIGIGNWDTYLYLENGRNFARMGWGDVPSIAPVLPMILSKMFLLAGHTYQEAIFNIDVVFYIIGILVFYLLLRLKFDENISLLGSVIFATFTLLYSWVAIGGTDIIGVTGTLLSVYLFFVAHKFNHKIYFLALPVAAYAFLSRYTAGVMIFTLIFYLIISRIDFNELKYVIIGGVLGVISISWFLYQFNLHLGTPFPFLEQFSGTVSNTVVMDSGFLPDSWYYLKHVPNYLVSYVPNVDTFNAIVNPMGNIPSIFSYIYIVLFLLAFVLIIRKLWIAVQNNEEKLSITSKVMLLVAFILFVVFLLTLGTISYIYSSVIFLVVLYILWKVLEHYNVTNLDYEFVMISLFVTYLVFQSILFTKNDRYFITVLPFIAYFIVYALNELFEYVKHLDNGIKVRKLLIAVIIIALIGNSLLFVSQIPERNDYDDIRVACDWLSDNRHINNTTYVQSDNWPAITWYMNIYGQRSVINTSNFTERVALASDILRYDPHHMASSYFIDTTSTFKYDYPGMNLIKEIDSVAIYENKYLKYGDEYLFTDEYNSRLKDEINEYNRTRGSYV